MKLALLITLVSIPLFLVGCGLTKNKDAISSTDTPTVKTTTTVVVEKGDTIKVDYVGTLEDGTLFDTSLEDKAKA